MPSAPKTKMRVKICACSNVVGCVSSVHTQVPASMCIIKGNVPTGTTIVIISIGEFAKNAEISLQLLVKTKDDVFTSHHSVRCESSGVKCSSLATVEGGCLL